MRSGESGEATFRTRLGVAGPAAAVGLALVGAGAAVDRHLVGGLSGFGLAAGLLPLALLAATGVRGLRSALRELTLGRERDRSRLVALLDGHESIRSSRDPRETADSAARAAVGLVDGRAAYLVVAHDGDDELEWLGRAGPDAGALDDGLRDTLVELVGCLRGRDGEPLRAVQLWDRRCAQPGRHAAAAVAIPALDAPTRGGASSRGALCVVHGRSDRALSGVELEALHDLAGLAAPGLDVRAPA